MEGQYFFSSTTTKKLLLEIFDNIALKVYRNGQNIERKKVLIGTCMLEVCLTYIDRSHLFVKIALLKGKIGVNNLRQTSFAKGSPPQCYFLIHSLYQCKMFWPQSNKLSNCILDTLLMCQWVVI